MERSPCLSCEFVDEDKNCERCKDCKRRLAYTTGYKMYQIDEKEEDKEMQEKRPVGQPRIHKKEVNPRVELRLQFMGLLVEEAQKVIGELKRIAKKEMRRVQDQALFFLKEGVENYKKKEKPNG